MNITEAVTAIEEAILECRYDHQKDNAFEAIRVLKHLQSENERLSSNFRTLEYNYEQSIREREDLEQQVEQLRAANKKAYYQGREHGEGNVEIRQDLITDNARLVAEVEQLKKQLEVKLKFIKGE
jgi:predicted RNase H-like nuclease (RuvC/YqgF family)